ncbi:hypothetical protein HYX10_05155 [Candidatus Woesearchaeota archaeon]|nr:hypothetical protein [Candidatus Woesearchaeota archaeon]
MIIKNKKGFEFLANWFSVLFIAIFVLSLFLALVIINAAVNYSIVVFAAVIIAYFIHMNKGDNAFPYKVLAVAFIVGYVAGYFAGQRAGHWAVLIALYAGFLYGTLKVLKLAK